MFDVTPPTGRQPLDANQLDATTGEPNMAAASMHCTSSPRTEVFRRRRLVVGVLLVAAVTGLLIVVGAAGTPATALVEDAPGVGTPGVGTPEVSTPGVGTPEVVVVVAAGQTVWQLALPHAPAGTPAHAFVADVLAHNGRTSAHVRPGDVLRIPVARP
jgi:hypothetical protein